MPDGNAPSANGVNGVKLDDKDKARLVDPYNYVGEVFGDVPADYPYADFLREYSTPMSVGGMSCDLGFVIRKVENDPAFTWHDTDVSGDATPLSCPPLRSGH